jgi:Dolichyl-phosphate-mannose-protein mannosyltransferase
VLNQLNGIKGMASALALSARHHFVDITVLVTIYVISLFFVNPIGDFPLMDDWSFARAVEGLVDQGDWRPSGFTAMPLIAQSLWGAIFCILNGFSFNSLRLSTVILAIVGIVGVYILFLSNHSTRILAISATLTFGFNPLFYELSTTFMTDVPFSTLAILAAIFYVRCIRRFSYVDLSIACALSLAATLCRQLGLFLPLAFAIALVVQRGFAAQWLLRTFVPGSVPAILPAVICVSALILFQHWMSITGRMPAQYGMPGMGAVGTLSIRGILSRIDLAALYLGLFCLPVLMLGSTSLPPNSNSAIIRALPWMSGSLFALGSIYFTFGLIGGADRPRWMPILAGNILPQGLGPFSLQGTDTLELLPAWFWVIVSALSVVGGMLLVKGFVGSSLALIRKIRVSEISEEDIIYFFLWTAVAAYVLPLLVVGFYDRYLVPLVPFLLYVNAGSLPRKRVRATIRRSASAVLITLIAVFAVLGTKDFLTWHRVLWEALAEFQQTARVNAHEIDGGFEFSGWFLYDPSYEKRYGKSWYWVDDDRYVISFSKLPKYNIIGEYRYFNWIPPEVRTLSLLERDPSH